MKVNIIGAGIAGLSVGCYLQMKGFETEIFESHSKAGGLCTSWKKGGYTFDGCIHWLLGSSKSNPFYKLWEELIDMDSLQFINHDIRVDIEAKTHKDKYGSSVFHLYTNLDRLEKYMLDIAPVDEKQIRKFIRSVRRLQKFEIPPNIQEVPELLPLKDKMRYAKHLPLLYYLFKWRKITNFTYAKKFNDPFLKEIWQIFFDGDEMPIFIITMPLASYDTKSAGYPIGGSTAFIDKIEDKYRSLGGKIRFNSEVRKIMTENDVATGIELKNGTQLMSDITISAADWYATVFKSLEGKYVNETILKLGREEILPVFYSMFMVSLGVNQTFEGLAHMIRFPIPNELTSPDGTKYQRLELHTYNYDPTLAPKGKTVLTLSMYTKNGDFWIDMRKSDPEKYKKCKAEFANQIIDILDNKLGNIRSNIEVIDIATPATFHRYTNNWKGSIQGWLPGKELFARPPVTIELPGLKNFYYCGHWSVPGGGLPTAVKSARDVVKTICHKYKITF
jgi:phytoene dehydrogenase-like protein